MEVPEIPNYKEWLASLEVGQKVAIEYFEEGKKPDYDARTIKKINGNIIEVYGMQPFKDGVITRFVGHFTRLCPVTQETLDIADRKQLIKRLYGFDPRKYSTEQLRKICEIIYE